MEQAYEWLPTATQHRTVTPYTIQLYQERITEIKRSEIEIVKEEVNKYFCSMKSNVNTYIL